MKFVRKANVSDSGQVITEACIGLALMVFVWILVSFSLFMANNHIRTAMAARHAAWLAGNDPGRLEDMDAFKEEIDNAFFFHNGHVNLEMPNQKQSKPPSGLVSGLLHDFLSTMGASSYLVKVGFGIAEDEVDKTEEFPFSLMKTRVPFMEESLLTDALSVESQCQWAAVGNTWSEENLMDWVKSRIPLPDWLKDLIF